MNGKQENKKYQVATSFYWSRPLLGSQQLLFKISVVTHALRSQHKFSCQYQRKVATLIDGSRKKKL